MVACHLYTDGGKHETLYYIACRKGGTDDMGSLHSGFFPYQSNGRSVEWLTLAGASDSAKEILRTNLGLDMPLWQQYIKSFVGLFTGIPE